MLVVEKGLRRNDNLLLLTASYLTPRTVILTRFYATTLSFGEEGNKKNKKTQTRPCKGRDENKGECEK